MTTKKQIEEDTKLIVLPGPLVEKARDASIKRGVGLSDYTAEALLQALRADDLGASVAEAVDVYRMVIIQRGAGAIAVPRTSLGYLIEKLNGSHTSDLRNVWHDSGVWYGRYLSSKMKPNEVFPFLEKELLLSWNLDEVSIKGSIEVAFSFTSFMMSLEFTELLLTYVDGLMESLGYRLVEKDYLRGMANLKFDLKPRQ